MNIIYVTNEFVTEKSSGGLATYLDNITTIMGNKGNNVTVITLSDESSIFRYRNMIRVIRVKASVADGAVSDRRRALLQMKNSWKIYHVIQKLVKEDRVDIIQAANYQAVGLFRSYKVPTVVRASSDSAVLRRANDVKFDFDKALLEKKWVDKLELYCIISADGAFAPSNCCADIVRKRSGRKLKIIESPYQRQDIQMDERIYKDRLQDKKYLFFNSSLSLLKGTHLGIRAAENLMDRYPDLYMVYAGIDYGLTGSGKSVEAVLNEQNKKYNGRVIYLNKLSREQLFPVIKHAFACVLPSRIDNLPNSCIEAMALGKIVIGTYGASFEQLIRNRENGLLIKRDSVKALIKAVDYLMGLNEQEYLEMGEKARKVTERLAPDIIYEQMMEYYQNVIEVFQSKKKFYFKRK